MAFLQKSLKARETMLIVFLFLLLGGASFYAGLHASAMAEWGNNDLGWSIRNGWHDVHHWQIANTYTWLGRGNRLTHSEWLFDVLLYGISLIPNGLAWLWRIMYLALFVVSFVLYWQKQERKIESYHLGTFTFLFLMGVSGFIVDRAQIFTYFFMLLMLSGWIARFSRKIQLMAYTVLVVLWGAFHGGFALFFVLAGWQAWQEWRKTDNKKTWLYFWVTGLGTWVLALLLALPLHGQSLLYPVQSIGLTDYRWITEWTAVSFTSWSTVFTWLLFGGVTAFAWKSLSWPDRILLFGLAVMSLHALRNEPLFVLALLSLIKLPSVPWKDQQISGVTLLNMVFFATVLLFLFPFPKPYADVDAAAWNAWASGPYTHEYGIIPWRFGSYADWKMPHALIPWDTRQEIAIGVMGGDHGQKVPDAFRQMMDALEGVTPLTTAPRFSSWQYALLPITMVQNIEILKGLHWKTVFRDSEHMLLTK